MRPAFGFGGHRGLMGFLFGTPIGPRRVTIAEIAGRKALKKAVRNMMPAQEDDKNSAEYNPVLGKLAFCALVAKLAELDKEAPFKSEAQRRKFYAMKSRGKISGAEVHKWEKETPDKKLPERVHKKEAGSLIGKGIGMLGKGLFSVGKAVAKPVMGVVKTMFLPSTKLQGAVSNTLWAGKAGLDAAKMHTPNTMAPTTPMAPMPRMAAELIEMTKQSLEMHTHGPMSTDTAGDEDVKKKSLRKNSSLAAPVSPGATAKGISGLTSGLSSRTGDSWLKRSTTGASHLNVSKASPEPIQMAGQAAVEAASAGSSQHINH